MLVKDLIYSSIYGVDSFSAVTDLNNVKIYKRQIAVIDSETGEILEEKYQGYDANLFKDFDIKLFIKFHNYFGNQKVSFTISSKYLGENYKRGIKSYDDFLYILYLYEEVFNIKIYDKSLNSFDFIDVDIFTDFDISFDEPITDYLFYIKKNVLFNARMFYTTNTYDNIRRLKGFQLNNRNDSSSNHFFKFYMKQIEINEVETTKKFIDHFSINFRNTSWRFEFTIRNKYSKDFFNYKSNKDFFDNSCHQSAVKKLLNHVHFFPKDSLTDLIDKKYISKKYSFNLYIIIVLFLDRLQSGQSFNQIWQSFDVDNLPFSDPSISRKRVEIRNAILEILKKHDKKVIYLKKDFYFKKSDL